MIRFSQVQSSPYYRDCLSFVQRLLSSDRFKDTLGQIYDGEEIWATKLELGDIAAITSPATRATISDDAARDVYGWIAHQTIDDAQMDGFRIGELEKLFRSNAQEEDRLVALALCLIEPLIRWYVAEYCQYLLNSGRTILRPRERRGESDTVHALQRWGVDLIFGGQLSIQDGKVVHVLVILCSVLIDFIVARLSSLWT